LAYVDNPVKAAPSVRRESGPRYEDHFVSWESGDSNNEWRYETYYYCD